MLPFNVPSSSSIPPMISARDLADFVQTSGLGQNGTQNSSPTARYLSELGQKGVQLHASQAVTLILALVQEQGYPELVTKILHRLEENASQIAEVDLKTLDIVLKEAEQAIDFEQKPADSTKAVEFFLALEKGELRTKYLAKFEEHQKAATLTHHKVGEILSEWVTEKCGPEVADRLKRDCFDEAFCRRMPLYATGTQECFSPSDLLSAEVLFEVELNEWVASASPEERRQEAAQLIRECKERKKTDLDLSSLNLRTLPALIGSLSRLQKLKLSRNKLQHLPDSIGRLQNLRELIATDNELQDLPASISALQSLEELDLRSNELQTLLDSVSQLSNLRSLNISNNRVQHLPDSIGGLQNLRQLKVYGNRLQGLPESIGNLSSLRLLQLSGNQLSSLPNGIASLSAGCNIFILNNPLSEAVISNLQQQAADETYGGPYIEFDMAHMAGGEIQDESRSLAEIVKDWYQDSRLDDEPAGIVEQWKQVEEEQDATAFGILLTRLRETPDYRNATTRPVLRARVESLLKPMLEHPELRARCFFLAEQATSSCDDNVALGLNDIETGVLAFQATAGQVNETALLDLGRGMFRLAQLEKISLAKIKSLKFVDQVEVLLAYQVGLRQKLELPVQARQMIFRIISGVTDDDLTLAEEQVRKAEASDQLRDFLTNWGPWQEHVHRVYGQEIEAESQMQMERLDGKAEAGELSTNEYNEQAKAAVEGRKQKLQVLLNDLTVQRLIAR